MVGSSRVKSPMPKHARRQWRLEGRLIERQFEYGKKKRRRNSIEGAVRCVLSSKRGRGINQWEAPHHVELEKVKSLVKIIELFYQRLDQCMHVHFIVVFDEFLARNDNFNKFGANVGTFIYSIFNPKVVDRRRVPNSDKLNKPISSLFIGGALQCGGEGCSQIGNALQLYCAGKTNLYPVQSFHDNVAMVGMNAMMRSNSTLEDFCRSYFMFHKMEANQPQSIFRFLPLLSFTESYIYQLDGLNEKLLQLPRDGVPILLWILRMFEKDPFGPLLSVLELHGLLTKRIKEEFREGEEYWTLERKLCRAFISNKEISIEDVTRAIHLKSFDYRVLNLLLYQLRGEKVNELHMEFLSISELLVEVSDDLFDYEDDVVENNFNILRMFVRYYGPSSAPIMMAKFITEVEEKYDKLSKALDPELYRKYQQRCEEATKEGGKKYGPSLGTWHIPPVIEDENGYRITFSSTSPQLYSKLLVWGANQLAFQQRQRDNIERMEMSHLSDMELLQMKMEKKMEYMDASLNA
ncbi:hypothetical protein DH2020_015323 [Rehmannia glutinosa]|uniref:Uncharacterized protein n=1 Tax=Rehmannia glutinosa TaxID=99300 RepID=A0ABR0WUX7_REHGL